MVTKSDLKQNFLQPFANELQDQVLALMKHPRSLVTFSDVISRLRMVDSTLLWMAPSFARDELMVSRAEAADSMALLAPATVEMSMDATLPVAVRVDNP